MATCGKVMRDWKQPPTGAPAPLMLYNSFVDEKVPFVPAAGPESKNITWYACGPTVYDVAHMGHARNYLSFDIVRRVLEDYFGYSVLMVMNVTDVDDKIILRARRNHLLAQYKASGKSAQEVKDYAAAALNGSLAKQQKKVAELTEQAVAAEAEAAAAADDKKFGAQRKATELRAAVAGEQLKAQQLTDSLAALNAVQAAGSSAADVDAVLAVAGDAVAEALDKELGPTVTDPAVFRGHAAKYEREFLEDMDALGCRRPDVLTRVSEYIPEVVNYVQTIIANGMAYEANGSVYFDTKSFRSCGHTYGKLNPWAVGSATLAAEGESNFETSEKRSPQDFALWKAAKPGEPVWESPWGLGRPGWHIECSAMASSIIGSRMDLHSGGEDLRFPHHDNELAQAEAFYHHDGCQQWVNYFLHCGHLHIEGLKMSKSLKNFVTIREALSTFNARQLRLMFCLQPWNKTMLYGEQSRAEMKAREAQLRNFFQNVDAAVRGIDVNATDQRWAPEEFELSAKVAAAQRQVDEALRDNINMPGAMDALSELIKAVNLYLAKKQEPGSLPRPMLLRKAAAFVTRILSVFGLIDAPSDKPGFSDAASASSTDASARYLDAFAAFRDEVRQLAKAKADSREVLAACDRVRDNTLVDLGVRLEDRPDGKAVWKLDDPAAMREEIAERAAIAAAAARKKLEGACERKAKELEKLEGLAALPSIQEALSDKFSKFDEATGEPTHDKEGNALEGKAKDKAKKDYEKAAKVREPLAKKLAEDPNCLATMRAEVAELQQQLAAMGLGNGAGN